MRKLFHILFISILVISCQKDKPSSCKVASLQSSGSDIVINYQYDNEERVIKIASTASGTTPAITSYFRDSILVSDGNSLSIYYLNSAGLATSSKTRFSPNPLGLALDNTYTYDNEGFLTNVREIFSQVYYGNIIKDTAFYTYTIQNGNIVKYHQSQYGSIYEENFEYNTIEAKSNIAFLLKPGFTSKYLGKASKNLVSVVKDQNGITQYSNSYKFDLNRNLIKIISTGPNFSRTTQYNYQCD